MKAPHDPHDLLIEGLMTTLSPGPGEGAANIAPMGPIIDPGFTRLILRPFKSSTTYRNLKATGEGVFHVTDDAAMIARAAIHALPPAAELRLMPARTVRGVVLADACRYYELRVSELDDREDRTTIHARVVASGRTRDFLGFNRARHAVLEAAILATRVGLTGPESVLAEFDRLRVMIDKTGGLAEHQAMEELTRFVQRHAGGEKP